MKFKQRNRPKYRTVTKFAFIPILINDYYVWLEWYKEKQELHRGVHPDLPNYYYEPIERFQNK